MSSPRAARLAASSVADVLAAFDLRGERAEAARCLDRNVLVLAGPGAGKTRLLSAHAAWLATKQAGRVLLLTFSRNAAREMRERVEQKLAHDHRSLRNVSASTLHVFALDVLRSYGSRLGLPQELEPLEKGDIEELARDAARELGIAPPMDFARWLDSVRRLGKVPVAPDSVMGQLLARVDAAMRKKGRLDYGGQITLATELLTQHPEVRDSLRHHTPFILVDEAQDCDAAQLALLEQLVGRDGKVHLFVVMDPDQSLYGWRDADPQRVQEWALEHNPQQFQLTENYRCACGINNLARNVLGRPPLPGPCEEGVVRLYRPWTQEDEARFLHTQVQALHNEHGVAYRRMAILGRTHYRLQEVQCWLIDQHIPVLDSGRGEWTQAEQRVLATLLFLNEWLTGDRPGPVGVHFLRDVLGMSSNQVRALEMEALGLDVHPGDLLVGRDPTGLWTKLQGLAQAGAIATLDLVMRVGGLLEIAEGEDENLRIMARDAKTLGGLLRRVRGGKMVQEAEDGLLITTFHGAKGLEFDVVFVVGCEDGVVPGRRAHSPADRLGEQRALYVAITRASREVIITALRGDRLSPLLPAEGDPLWSALDGARDRG